jgi:predicted nucleic acid-binding protein
MLIDTSAIFAIANRADAYHAQAARFLTDWLKDGRRVIVTDYVFSEAVTLLKARMGTAAAVETGRRLRQPAFYEWLRLSLEDESAAWAVFEQYADKEWSFVDCVLCVMAGRLGVPVFSFDHHFEQMPEIERVP